MKVFIVTIESIYGGSSHWQIDRVFASMDAAKAYIVVRKSEHRYYYDIPEFNIETEEVYA